MKPKTIIKCLALVLGVIVIPLLYSYFYLTAFWDPYNRLDTVPVAVVNKDKGAVINGVSRNLGKEAEDKLLDDGSLKFIVTDEEDAKNGTEGTKYYATITFPENFSESVASASTEKKETAIITFSANEKRNYIASQIMKNAVTKIEESTRSSINKELTATLCDKIKEVPDKLGTLNDGLLKLSDGASQLYSGTSQFADGQNALSDGIKSLNSGIVKLSDGANALDSGLEKLNGGLLQTSAGAKKISSSVSSSLPALKTGIKQINGGAQTLLAQFSPSKDASNPTIYDGVTGVSNGLQSLLAQFSSSGDASKPTLADSVSTLSSGTESYTSFVNNTLFYMIKNDPSSSTMLNEYKTNLAKLQLAYATATDETAKAQYESQIKMVANLVTIYSAAMNSSTEEQFETTLVTMAQQDATKASVVSSGATLTAGTKQLASQFKDGGALKTSVQQLAGASNQVAAQFKDGGQFKTGVAALANGTAQLADSTSSLDQLSSGLDQLSGALSSLEDGSSQLASGSKQLSGGLASAKSGSETLLDGSNKLASASSELNDGAKQLSDGINTAKDGVQESIDDVNDQVSALSGLDDFAEEPAKVKEEPINSIPNYGTAFAPYFMSLSLWVGAILIFFGIYLDADDRIKVLSRHSDKKLVRVGVFALIGVAQAIALALIAQFALGLSIENIGAFYGSCILVSLVFISIVEFLIVNLKDLGKFLAIAFLVLQLASCGGTFPVETTPKFFRVLYKFMPMTYSVNLFKETTRNFNASAAGHDIWVLIGIFVVFTGLTILFSLTRKAKVAVQEKLQAQSAN